MLRVLVVEDDAMTARALVRLLQLDGITAHLVGDAELALELLLLLPPMDVLIVDLTLPGMSGEAFVRVLRRAGNLTPVILMSGAPDNEIADAAERCGANAWIPKPIGRGLLVVIEDVLTRRSLPPGT